MRILSDNTITNADVTGTNLYSYAGASNLKTFDLSKKMIAVIGETDIVLDFNADTSPVNCVVLCGSNLSSGASAVLSYSDTDPDIPELTIPLPKFSNFLQLWFLDSPVEKRFWKISISDPDPQGNDGVELGYIYIGEYIQIRNIQYPHSPALVPSSSVAESTTKQRTGSKIVNYRTVDFVAASVTQEEASVLLNVVKDKMNVDPIVLITYEDGYEKALYPPMYGVLNSSSYSYPADGAPDDISITFNFEEIR